ncbi:MAG: 50S ribosomal protein L11 methyltransferase, partial [Deltaproteobacteria bacterium]|nr:50S ribosomal protein L11 methyltransferase [Deltaproteobacteria bacterium]
MKPEKKINKWIAAKVIFDTEDMELARDLISDLFYEMGLPGVVIEEKGRDPDADWGDDAEAPQGHDAVVGYIPLDHQAEEKCATLENRLVLLEKKAAMSCRLVYETIDAEDWEEAWKAYFWPEKISTGIVVKPTWREYDSHPGEIVLEIDPGMAFGTGTHPTSTL